MKKQNFGFYLLVFVILLSLTGCSTIPPAPTTTAVVPLAAPTLTPVSTPLPVPTAAASPASIEFNKARAYQDVERQVSFGPRLPASEAHAQAVDWMQKELQASGWEVEIQETTYINQLVRNVIARRGVGNTPWIIIGAHYDSRFFADNDPNPDNRDLPVPGANDGASGVAVLLELARILPEDLDKEVWFVFFDTEDQGSIPGWDWILGSRAFVESLTEYPDDVVIIDMIGDADLAIPKERSSNPELTEEIWQIAVQRGHGDIFLSQPGTGILDDHTPFLEKGIRAIDIIDFTYPYWHTIADTPDKVSPDSLFAVGDTLLAWLLEKK